MAILEQSWSTAHLLPGKALPYWRDVICENLLQMHIQSSQERAFLVTSRNTPWARSR